MRALLLLLFIITLCIGSAVVSHNYLKQWGQTKVSITEPKVIELSRGMTLSKLSTELEQNALIDSAIFFRWWVKFFDNYAKYQAGKYRFTDSVSPDAISSIMKKGDIYTPTVLEYTFPEGFTLPKAIKRLAALNVGTEEELNSLAKDQNFLNKLSIKGKTIEGYLYPATYKFVKMPSAEEAFSEAVKTFWNKLPTGYESQVNKLGLNLVEAITFASLIEMETAVEEERSLVSEVIWRRLKNNAALAIDAALIYGIKDYNGNISRKHLEDKSNPYNTRIHPGLPPTPICSPSVASLMAVLSPSDEGYYYYVHDPSRGNRHHFSKTLKEHNQWVRKLVIHQRKLRRAK